MKLKVFHVRLTRENLHEDEEKMNQFMDGVSVQKTACELIQAQTNFWSILVFYEPRKTTEQSKTSDKLSVTNEEELSDAEQAVYLTLKQWRYEHAQQANISAYMVCHNQELMTIAKIKPQTLEELAKIKGFGPHKIATIGEHILALLNSI